MKRIIATLFVTLFVLSLSISAHAGPAGKVAALLNSADKSALAQEGYAVTVAYYTVASGWWTGLAIYNSSDESNTITIGCLDADGVAQAAGQISLIPYAFDADVLANFMTAGSVPDTGSIFIFGTAPFLVDRYLGYASGFGELQLESEPY